VEISNKKNQSLMAGEYLLATFPVRPIEHVMEIPRNSVFNANEVFLVREGRLVRKEINVIKENERTLIFNGLPEGDTIVVQQLINVSEGTLVQLDKETSGPGGGSPGMQGQGPGQRPGGPDTAKGQKEPKAAEGS